MTRDLDTEGPVAGQQQIHCPPCPFKACAWCPYPSTQQAGT